MANQIANKNYWTFVKGIVTEASPLLYPENASIDEANFVLNRDGSRERRLGIDYELGYSLIDSGSVFSTLANTGIATCRWNNVESNPDITLTVAQVSNILYFFDTNSSSQSGNLKYSFSIHTSHLYESLSFAVLNGSLFCASPTTGPFKVTLSIISGSGTYTISSATKTDVSIQIRDIFGVDDGYAIDYRPTATPITPEHKYNLLNQGWRENLINDTYTAQSVYPSNSDIWHVAKDASDVYQSAKLLSIHFGSSRAPRGKFIIDAFVRGADRASQSGVTGIPDDVESGKISCIASYSGRIFYSGVTSSLSNGDARSPNYSGFVFYSRLIESESDYSKCYTDADPTSEEISDVIASDGGYIQIPDAYNIVAMQEYNGGLFVFAENGVWAISGTDKGFSSIDNTLKKVTDIGCVGKNTIVSVESNSIIYWAESGIYSITGDVISGYKSQSISITTIQTLYDGISLPVKRNVKGIYDPVAKQIRWLYTIASTYNPSVNPYLFDRELILDVTLESYYVNTFDITGPYVVDYAKLTGEVSSSITYNVISGTDSVVVGADTVVATETTYLGASSGIKYLTIIPNIAGNTKVTFSNYRNSNFLDWYTYDSVGKNFESYLVTGYELLGDSMRGKQVEYIVFHFLMTETAYVATVDGFTYDSPSSCLFQARFDFADSSASGKWSTETQAYRLNRLYTPSGAGAFDYGYQVVTTKNKVRGRGKAVSYKIRSEQGKDMKLLGWSVQYAGNSSV